MNCWKHDKMAYGVCYACHRGVCKTCGTMIAGRLFCPDHNPDTLKKDFKKMREELKNGGG